MIEFEHICLTDVRRHARASISAFGASVTYGYTYTIYIHIFKYNGEIFVNISPTELILFQFSLFEKGDFLRERTKTEHQPQFMISSWIHRTP